MFFIVINELFKNVNNYIVYCIFLHLQMIKLNIIIAKLLII
jgi:hypothetical protein